MTKPGKFWQIFYFFNNVFKDSWRKRLANRSYLGIFGWFVALLVCLSGVQFFSLWADLEETLALFSLKRDPFSLRLMAELLSGGAIIVAVMLFSLGIYYCQNLFFLQTQQNTEELKIRQLIGESDFSIKASLLGQVLMVLLPLAAIGFLVGTLIQRFMLVNLGQLQILKDASNAYRMNTGSFLLIYLSGIGLICLINYVSTRKLLELV